MTKVEKWLTVLSGIIVPFVLALVGWWITSVQSVQTDRIIVQQKAMEKSQRDSDRVTLLLASLASENKTEQDMAFAFVEYLQENDQLSKEILKMLKEYYRGEGTIATQPTPMPGLPQVTENSAGQRVASLFSRVFVHIPNEEARPLAQEVVRLLEGKDFIVPSIQRVGDSPKETELRYFRENEAREARSIVQLLEELDITAIAKLISGYETSTAIRPRHYEFWIGTRATTAARTPTSNGP